MIQVSREELISNIEKYLNMAINDEQIMIMDGKIELAAFVRTIRYNVPVQGLRTGTPLWRESWG